MNSSYTITREASRQRWTCTRPDCGKSSRAVFLTVAHAIRGWRSHSFTDHGSVR